jgi:hypothetical protein
VTASESPPRAYLQQISTALAGLDMTYHVDADKDACGTVKRKRLQNFLLRPSSIFRTSECLSEPKHG